MRIVALSELETVVAGLVALQLAMWLMRGLPVLGRCNVPTPVVAGVLGSGCVAALRGLAGIEVRFGTSLTDLMLLVFFTTVGLSAKFSALKAGGKPLVILCAATVLLIVAQNAAGILVALGFGANPYYGVLVGSISFVGGPGTAAAWAKEAEAAGLRSASEVAVAGATLAVVVGALVAGPVTGWLVRRWKLRGSGSPSAVPWSGRPAVPPCDPAVGPDAPVPGSAASSAALSAAPQIAEPVSVERTMSTFLLLFVAVYVGQALNQWARAQGFMLPGFLTAMLAGVLITNGADLLGRRLDFAPIARGGELSLQLFLVMFLMSLKLWTLGAAIAPLLVNVLVQLAVSIAIAVWLLFRWLGRDYDAAVTVGGFLGFGLSSMTVGMASMDSIARRYGPSPKAFLLVTLAGSFFVDLANAVIVQSVLNLPLFDPPAAP